MGISSTSTIILYHNSTRLRHENGIIDTLTRNPSRRYSYAYLGSMMAMAGAGGGDAVGQAAMPPNFLLDHVSPATRLLEKRRQMFEIQEALEAQKEEFARQEHYRLFVVLKKKIAPTKRFSGLNLRYCCTCIPQKKKK